MQKIGVSCGHLFFQLRHVAISVIGLLLPERGGMRVFPWYKKLPFYLTKIFALKQGHLDPSSQLQSLRPKFSLHISMIDATPLLMHWSYVFLALTHQYNAIKPLSSHFSLFYGTRLFMPASDRSSRLVHHYLSMVWYSLCPCSLIIPIFFIT